jgi:hypothetical protein
VEGAEYEVLPAVFTANCQPSMISMEIHDYNRRGQQLLSLLKAHSYGWNESLEPSHQCVTICATKRTSK